MFFVVIFFFLIVDTRLVSFYKLLNETFKLTKE